MRKFLILSDSGFVGSWVIFSQEGHIFPRAGQWTTQGGLQRRHPLLGIHIAHHLHTLPKAKNPEVSFPYSLLESLSAEITASPHFFILEERY